MQIKKLSAHILLLSCLLWGCSAPQQEYDLIIRNGMVYDGSGKTAVKTDIGVNADTIAIIGDLSQFKGKKEIDAMGLAVAPGFINMLSWATESLLIDGNSQSDIRQGITLEVFGEGTSMGPLSEPMKEEYRKEGGDFKYENQWTTLGEYLAFLEKKGVACNVASFMGATTARIYVLGYEDRKPTEEELKKMQDLVRQAMEEGALGLGSSLIYAPAFYAQTDELIALCKVAAEYDGLYISHLRSEGNSFEKAVDEFLTIAREAGIRAEIYHLKAAGKENWHKIDKFIAKIDSARKAGLEISTDMYTYIAGATGLDAAMPPWVQEGGYEKWAARLQKPEIRKKVIQEMKTPTTQWENLYLGAGSPENVLLIGFKNDSLKYLTGKTLAEVAKMRRKSPEETAIDLVVQDGSRVGTAYFMMSEENIKKQIALPYMSFGSDAESLAPEGSFLKYNPHPRAYGNVARLLGKYVREEKIIPLEEAIRKLTSLSAEKLRIKRRGWLKEGYFADIVVFDADKIQDHATFEKPHQYATGMVHVFVNGVQVLQDGEHTGAKAGRFIKRGQ